MTVPATRNPDIQKTKNQAGIYTTGEGERKTVTVDGKPVRIGPNSTLDTRTPQTNKFKQFIDILTGNVRSEPGGTTGVRSSVPSAPSKSYPGLASPVQYTGTGLGVNSQIGGYQQANQQIYFGSYGQGAPFSANQNALRQQALGLNVPNNQGYQYYGSYGQGAPFSANQNMLRQQALGLTQTQTPQNNPYAPFFNNQQLGLQPSQFSYSPQGQPNSYTPYKPMSSQFSYAPQGQQNSYTPYPQQQRQGVGEVFNAVQNYQAPSLAKSALTAPPRDVAFNQANFQSGANRGGGSKRWWIGRNRQEDDGGAAAAALAAQQAAELAANQAITMNPGSVQQATWRPVY